MYIRCILRIEEGEYPDMNVYRMDLVRLEERVSQQGRCIRCISLVRGIGIPAEMVDKVHLISQGGVIIPAGCW